MFTEIVKAGNYFLHEKHKVTNMLIARGEYNISHIHIFLRLRNQSDKQFHIDNLLLILLLATQKMFVVLLNKCSQENKQKLYYAMYKSNNVTLWRIIQFII